MAFYEFLKNMKICLFLINFLNCIIIFGEIKHYPIS